MEEALVGKKIESLLQKDITLDFIQAFLFDFPASEVYIVGGALRDLFLQRPYKDIDFVIRQIEGSAIEEWLSKRGRVDYTGKHFGVFKFRPMGLPDKFEDIDIALPRTESAHETNAGGYKDFDINSDHNLPIEDDLKRRDFTINAIAYEIRSKSLIDPFGGVADIEQKLIRAVGEPMERLSEDYSRILRGIRLACELDFDIEEKTFDAICELQALLNNKEMHEEEEHFIVPREVIGKELSRALYASNEKALALFRESGIIKTLMHEVEIAIEEDEHYLLPLFQKPLSVSATLALLLRHLPHQTIHARLKENGFLSVAHKHPARANADHIAWIIKQLQEGVTIPERSSEFEIMFMNPRGERFFEVLTALNKGDIVEAARTRQNQICSRWNSDCVDPIPALISGRDIIQAGIEKGPQIRKVLQTVRDAQLDGKIMSREAALTFLKSLTD